MKTHKNLKIADLEIPRVDGADLGNFPKDEELDAAGLAISIGILKKKHDKLIKDSILEKATLYSLISEKDKGIEALRRALISHGQICEQNHKLRQKIETLEMKIEKSEKLKSGLDRFLTEEGLD